MTNSTLIQDCPLCGSDQLKPFLTVKDFSISKEDFILKSCTVCDFTFTANPPSAEHAGPYYQSDVYISHSDTKKGLVNRVYHWVRDLMLGKKKSMIESVQKGRSLLDVGTGTGYFLNYMKGQGYQTQGIEISKQARDAAIQNFGLEVNEPNHLLSGQLNQQFDVVTMWHVLEHIYSPELTMKAIHGVLKKEGHLVIAVPNKDSFDATNYEEYWAGYDVPRHLWHFTPTTMETFAKKNDFKIVKNEILPFDSFYVSMLSEQYRKTGFHFIKGMVVGFASYLAAIFNQDKASSVVYFLQKM